ncbi:GntR family transcriptional regulator [Microbacterium invictum]|uniref:DNA-binding GntR family transcriptional regulator n=1 Tax=Microbacterium invictum TaxID=515415 RepID=A0AA40VMU9_9MICO|nr:MULTISPECIES: GntR family transcriptional regulator [Microbacterium]MBB4140806.1 DNA-binding GntR family transcriptional regulator [Microbacterium invictum]
MPNFLVDVAAPLDRLPSIRAESHGDRVQAALQQAILDGRLPQGAPLVERELAEQLGVSKTPVREALKRLESSGLVESSYRSVTVRRLDANIVRSLHDARLVVEPEAVRLGVLKVGAGERASARRALDIAHAAIGSGDTAMLGIANRGFHQELYRLCANEWLVEFLDKLQALSTFVATAGWRLDPTFDAEAEEHREILHAVERGDAEAAASLTRDHIGAASRALLDSLKRQGEGGAE